MDKKIMITFVFILLAIIGIGLFQTQSNKAKSQEKEKIPTEIKTKKIEDVSSISLYVTDYVYDTRINGYVYKPVTLGNEQMSVIKEEALNIDLNTSLDDIVYGKYKLVIGEHIFFFDNDSKEIALYLNDNKTIFFPKAIKRMLITNFDNCSCCNMEECKINMCACKEA